MTHAEAMALPAGRLLDALVAYRLGDYTEGILDLAREGALETREGSPECGYQPGETYTPGPPKYSTEAGAALLLWKRAEYAELVRSSRRDGEHVRCLLDFGGGKSGHVEGPMTEELALCRAFLDAQEWP